MDQNLSSMIAANASLIQLGDISTVIINLYYGKQNVLNWSTIVGVILGWFLSEGGRYFYAKRTTDVQNKKLLALLNQDWTSNKLKMKRNIDLIKREITALQTNQHVVFPLELLETGFWDIIKYNLPNQLINDDQITIIRDIAAKTNRINERIQSRENFRISNLAMSNFCTISKIYDDNLIEEIEALTKKIDDEQPNFTYERLHISIYDRLNAWLLPSVVGEGY